MADAAAVTAAKGLEEKKKEKGGGGDAGKMVPFVGLFGYADGKDVLLMLVGTVAALGNGFAQPLMTLIFGQLINAFGGATTETILDRVIKVVLNFVYLGTGTGVAAFLQVSCWTMTGERQATRIRSLYLKSVLKQDVAFFDVELTTGQAVSRMSGDTVIVQDAIGEKVGKFLQLTSNFIGGFIVAFVKGWLLSLVMLSCIPPVVIAGGVVSKVLSKISRKGQASYSDAGNVVEQTIGAIKTVISFNGEKQAIALYNKFTHKAYKATVEEGITNGFGRGSVFFVFFASYGLAIWYGGKLIISRGYSGGDIVSIVFAVMVGALSLGHATPCIAAFAAGQSAAYRLFTTIKRKPEIDPDDASGKELEDIRGDVELKDVYFSYPARPEQLIFDGFSLHVPNGTTMAIVGESGSGKSTVISLVERFYDPQAGEVLVDGINIKSLRLGWIRGKIGLVSQEPLLFMASVKDNIRYGKEDATIEEIKRAAELANAANFIDKFPNGYDTSVGQRGAQLSGGQKQRIAIARAIIKNPKILLLDEATSALDVESERTVQEALNRIMVDRTTLVVAHRLSTVRNADCISVVQKGKIVEQGHHDELVINPDGAYSQLIRLQKSPKDKQKLDCRIYDTMSKSRRLTSIELIGRSSAGNSSRHSFILPFGLPSSVELLEGNDTNENLKEEAGDSGIPKQTHLGRLANLNKPELPFILLGSLAAAVHGMLLPVSGIIISNAIIIFFEPADKLRKDSQFWGLLGVVLGIVSIIAVPLEYFLFGVTGGKLIERIRALSFRSIVHQDVAWFDDPKNSSGTLSARLSVDALNVRRLVGDSLALAVEVTSTLITGFVIAMIADWKLCLIIICVIPLVGLQGYAQIKFLKGFSEDAKVFFALMLATFGISETSALASDSKKAKESTVSIFALLDRKSKIDSGSNEGLTLDEVKGDIDFRHVSFKYPSRPDVQIFSSFTLHIPTGKTVALVGESGSGKSTVIALLEQFYRPDSGTISLDGVEIKNLKINWLRNQMGLVSQEPVLFNDTIRANIAYGKQGEVTEEELIKVAKLADAHEFISSLPQGYQTTVGERGVQLSGGQKQRVAIARAILKDPRILLLDEATSALDAESERIVQDALDHVMVGRTTVIVAHRLSTIKGADIIAVLKDGMIVEKGSHETLMNIEDGFYTSLVELRSSSP
ncbi:hypothetical protein SEVIR_5G286300v4 [Setaria viridis]|uniref:MDR-like ABC transporter n=1 Tax=Setaria viridis TaxID=4556 RepID=A0A4U6UJB9_SETVI|nr:ABC transporter B family member 4-like isoform X2 [Setaria viridis]TKW16228.1 hypothetical protein SEVIR_5G286300v2 [Setaria viridis]